MLIETPLTWVRPPPPVPDGRARPDSLVTVLEGDHRLTPMRVFLLLAIALVAPLAIPGISTILVATIGITTSLTLVDSVAISIALEIIPGRVVEQLVVVVMAARCWT